MGHGLRVLRLRDKSPFNALSLVRFCINKNARNSFFSRRIVRFVVSMGQACGCRCRCDYAAEAPHGVDLFFTQSGSLNIRCSQVGSRRSVFALGRGGSSNSAAVAAAAALLARHLPPFHLCLGGSVPLRGFCLRPPSVFASRFCRDMTKYRLPKQKEFRETNPRRFGRLECGGGERLGKTGS